MPAKKTATKAKPKKPHTDKPPAQAYDTKAGAMCAVRNRYGKDWRDRFIVVEGKAKNAGKYYVRQRKAGVSTKKQAVKAARKSGVGPKKLERVNDAHRPRENTVAAQVWSVADRLAKKRKGEQPDRADVVDECRKLGIVDGTTFFQWSRWKKFNGFTGEKHRSKKRAVTVSSKQAAAGFNGSAKQ